MTSTLETPSQVLAAQQPRRSIRMEKLKQAWREGTTPDALHAFACDPELGSDKIAAIELAYEEFCLRTEAGESLDASAFCDRFTFGDSLRRLLAIHDFFGDHPDVLEAVPSRWPETGEILGDFVVHRELGRGGFSRVYLACESSAGGRPVVLKISCGQSQEAQTLGPLSHPHLIPVLSCPTIGRWKIVVMPFVGQATLQELLTQAWSHHRRNKPRTGQTILDAATGLQHLEDPPYLTPHPFPITSRDRYEDAVQKIAISLLSALAYLHQAGIAHRDIKPSNVLIGPTGHPYLLDFNLASHGADALRAAGTIPYMSPEQLRLILETPAPALEDCRPSDIFAFGVLLFELLTGQHPYGDFCRTGNPISERELARAVHGAQQSGHAPLALFNCHLNRSLRDAVERCLSLEPRSRPTARELLDLLATRRKPLRKWFVLTAGVAVVTMCGGFGAVALSNQSARNAAADMRGQTLSEAALTSSGPFDRAQTLLQNGEYALAAGEFLKIGQASNNGQACAMAAYCYSLKKDHQSGIMAADQAIASGFATAEVYANRAYNQFMVNHLEQCQSDCDRALDLDPNLVTARFTRARYYLNKSLGDDQLLPPSQALVDIEFVIRHEPSAPNVLIIAASLYLQAREANPGYLDRAANLVQQAIAAGKPSSTFSKNKLFATALQNHPVFVEAIRDLTPSQPGIPEFIQPVNPLRNQ